MHESFASLLSAAVDLLSLVAGAFLIAGLVLSTMKWAQQVVSEGSVPALNTYRKKLGRTVLIGLELLLAATILKTITAPPTVEAFGFILFTVVIRTALGWTTSLETYGRWPWQKR